MFNNSTEKKVAKQTKATIEVAPKHKRVKSDVNKLNKKMFPDYHSNEHLSTIQKENPVMYSNKTSIVSFTARVNKNEIKNSGLSTIDNNKPKVQRAYKVLPTKSMENSPLVTASGHICTVVESSGRPPTAMK